MVANPNQDLYPPFPHALALDDGPQSSEDGSSIHSPVFDPPFSAPRGDSSRHRKLHPCRVPFPCSQPNRKKVRYNQDHLDVRAGLLASELGYNSILHVRPPFIDNQHPVSEPAHNQLTYRSELTLPTRSQLTLNTSPHLPAVSRPAPPSAQTASTEYSDRSLSAGHSHDPPFLDSSGTGSTFSLDGDLGSSPATEKSDGPATSPTNGQRKEVSVVVIACRQWYDNQALMCRILID